MTNIVSRLHHIEPELLIEAGIPNGLGNVISKTIAIQNKDGTGPMEYAAILGLSSWHTDRAFTVFLNRPIKLYSGYDLTKPSDVIRFVSPRKSTTDGWVLVLDDGNALPVNIEVL